MMKNLFVSILILLTMPACAQYDTFEEMARDMSDHDVPTISVTALEKAINSGTVVLLDARSKKEYEVSHIEGAIHVGYDDFNEQALQDIPGDTPVVVYCSVGYRSGKIGEKLTDMGYENVRNLLGGIFSWVNNAQPIVDSDGQPTKKIHAYNEDWGQWLKKGEKVY